MIHFQISLINFGFHCFSGFDQLFDPWLRSPQATTVPRKLKNKLLEIENDKDLSGLLIFASEGINGTICAEKNVIDNVINLLNYYELVNELKSIHG